MSLQYRCHSSLEINLTLLFNDSSLNAGHMHKNITMVGIYKSVVLLCAINF